MNSSKKPPFLHFLTKAIGSWILFSLLLGLIQILGFLFSGKSDGNYYSPNPFQEDDKTYLSNKDIKELLTSTKILASDSTSIYYSREWLDPFSSVNNHFKIDFSVKRKEVKYASIYRRTGFSAYQIEDYLEYWNKIYSEIHKQNPNGLKKLKSKLKFVGSQNKLNRFQFAQMVITFVQDIPYSYILSRNGCELEEHKNKPCLDSTKYGLLSPSEFAYTLKGDCDTRTLLLYNLLKSFGYKPLILISREYRHAMLALNILSSGDFLYYKGERFYFWETTNYGWKAGMLPPEMKNKTYWKIALAYDE